MSMKKKTIEDYVELIYVLSSKGKARVKTSEVASSLSLSPASVTEVFQKLSSEGFLDYVPYGGVLLTAKGRRVAVETKRRHDTLKQLLVLLGVNEGVAEEDACRIEHVVHAETMSHLRKFVEFVQMKDGMPRWLENYNRFFETGEFEDCSQSR